MVFIGRTDAEAETPILWPPDAKNWLIGKDRDAGRDWGQEERGRQRVRRLDGITASEDSAQELLSSCVRGLLIVALLLQQRAASECRGFGGCGSQAQF